jgi:hypothetical protein
MSSFLTYRIVWLILFLTCICAQSNDSYLTHYWPIEKSQMSDQIGMAHMTQGDLARYASDRFGCADSALDLNGGWTQVPEGFYFDTSEFTISVWVYPQQVGKWARVVDLSNTWLGIPRDNVIISLDSDGKPFPTFSIFKGAQGEALISNISLIENKWQFLAVTFNGTTMSIYINGIMTGINSFAYPMPKIIRKINNIGKSWNSRDGKSLSYLDDLRFFNISLSQEEIVNLMNSPGIVSLLKKLKYSALVS